MLLSLLLQFGNITGGSVIDFNVYVSAFCLLLLVIARRVFNIPDFAVWTIHREVSASSIIIVFFKIHLSHAIDFGVLSTVMYSFLRLRL